MIAKNLIIYKFVKLYHILQELGLDLNFNVLFADNEKNLNDKIKNFNNYLIITNKEYSHIDHQFVLNSIPINISKLIEKINIELLKTQFNNQSEFKVKNYVIDLNSREICTDDINLKLTEKEVSTIVYLSKKNAPVTIEELEKNVWQYHSDIETHTVETHIYRLRQKILKTFKDKAFILSKKNGYQIK